MTEAKIVLTGDDSPLRKALGSARDGLNRFGNEAAAPFGKLRDAMGNLGNVMAGFGAIKLTQLADQGALIQARLKDVSGSFVEAQKAQTQLYASAQRLQVSYADMASGFSRMLPAVKAMGGGANEAIRLAEILASTARLSGASSDEAASSAQQFAQALSSGVLQGDELKSILENNGTLSRAMAEGLGVTVGELKKLGAEGKLTSDKVAGALLGQYDQIQARSAELPATVGGAWTQITNAFQGFISKANEGTGVFAALSSVMSGLARFIDALSSSIGGVGTESDKLNKNNSLKQWGETVGGIFAYIADLGRGIGVYIEALGQEIGALAAATTAAVRGDFVAAGKIMEESALNSQRAWAKIGNLTTGGEGSTLRAYALNSGQDAPATDSTATLKSTAPAKKDKEKKAAADPSKMPALEAALAQEKQALAESGKLLEMSKAMERAYWQDILDCRRLNAHDSLSIQKKVALLSVGMAKDDAKDKEAIDKDAVETWNELELAKLEGQRIAAKAMLDQDQINKGQFIDREIEFEERRYQIYLEYLRKRQEGLPEGDKVGRAKLSGDGQVEGAKHKNKKAQLQGDKESEASSGIDVEGMFSSMGKAATQGFGAILTGAKKFQGALAGIFQSIKMAFIKSVVLEPMQAQLASWAKLLAAKLGFGSSEQAAEIASSAKTVAIKSTETTAVVANDSVQAATGAAKSQAGIPYIGPILAIAAMAAMFAAVSGMGSKTKSARNGYDIPAGVNPMVQLHEEEMVLPKEQANAVRDMASGGGGGSDGGAPSFELKGASAGQFFIAHRSELVSVLKSLQRDFRLKK